MPSRERELFHRPEKEGIGELSVDRVATVPNAITTVRLACIPIFVWLLFGRDSPGWAGFVLGLLGSTDWIDGYIARRFDQSSNFGAMYDPIVDRMMMVVGIVSVIIGGFAPLWFAWIVLIREVLVSMFVTAITAMGAKRMDVTWWGKVGTFANMGAFPSFLLSNEDTFRDSVQTFWLIAGYAFAIPGLIFSLLAAGQYLKTGRQALDAGRAEHQAAQ